MEKIPSLQEQPIQSVITVPGNKAVVSAARLNNGSYEPLQVQGYSYSGGGRGIVRVDVSIDGGKTWKIAKLTGFLLNILFFSIFLP